MFQKKILCLALTALVGITATNIAMARNANSNLCRLTFNALQRDGFANHAAYRVDAIKQLLDRAGVKADLSGWDPNQLYELSYSCKLQHGVTYPSFVATPVTNVVPVTLPAAQAQTVIATVTPGVISWEATPPGN
jgi:hypothetical protein